MILMPELSLFRFSAIFITEPLTKTLPATGRPPRPGLPATGSAQEGKAQGRAKARTLTGQDGHFHVAVGYRGSPSPGHPQAGQPERPSGSARGQNPSRFPRPPLGDATLGQTVGPTVGREVPCHSTGEQAHKALVCLPPPWLTEGYGDPVFLSFPSPLVSSA